MDLSKIKNPKALEWIEDMIKLCEPDQVVYCDGSEAQNKKFEDDAVAEGCMERLNPKTLPGCLLHRTDPNDVARTEGATFICTKKKEDAGPINNWMSPEDAYAETGARFKGSMKGKTMYVIPFIMGVAGSPFAKVGIELTDSLYVVLNMNIMTKMGDVASNQLGADGEFTKCLHARGDLSIEKRRILHFPEDNTIWSYASGYGGNVLLGKKCLALRIASWMAKNEGWMAEHMLILGLTNKKTGKKYYIAGAFPSACGKTNLAMLIPPKEFDNYEIETVGDDIAWIRIGKDGRFYAVNPENGFFGVAPGTSMKSNPNALLTTKKNTIFTNVVKTEDGNVWWEGMKVDPPAHGTDWLGKPWTPDSPDKGAHPNSRFTAPAAQCPCISPEWQNPEGVPLSAILFGGRRAKTAPLVFQSFSWNHGTFLGATMCSETTAAATGAVGVIRRDPMAMRPFCGYNMGEYFGHWIEMGAKSDKAPKIFHVNWFKQDENGDFMWPGYGDNARVLDWIVRRCDGEAGAKETAIGYVPNPEDLNLTGLDIDAKTLDALLEVDKDVWKAELPGMKEFLGQFGDKLPKEVKAELDALEARLNK